MQKGCHDSARVLKKGNETGPYRQLTISLRGLFRWGTPAGRRFRGTTIVLRRLTKALVVLLLERSCGLLLLLGVLDAQAQLTDVLTYHNDNARTGQALKEQILSPANVNLNHFGKLWVLATDGRVDAQPLYAAGVSIPSQGTRNVLFVATEHDTVYAFDADGTSILWQATMLANGETPSDDRGCYQVSPEIGITATPVIDRQMGPNGTLFVVAMSKDSSGNYYQRLHALDLSTGADRLAPVPIAASYPGTGDGSSGGYVIFNPAQYKERPGLLLLNGVVYTAWSSHCDNAPYTGWIIGYDESSLVQTSVLDITPNGSEGSIWMSGAGLAADTSGNIFCLVGNGTFDSTLNASGFPSGGDFGNAFLKVSTANRSLNVADYFATYQTPSENNSDEDLGSGGALVLPPMTDAQGVQRQLAVGAGKDANIYLVDSSNMGKFNPLNDNGIYQELSGALGGQVFSMPAYFNGTLYYGAVSDAMRAFPFQSAKLGAVTSSTTTAFEYPGATPSISANGNLNGIVWAAENSSPAVLHAYSATNLSFELYNSNQATNGRDQFGSGNKFITPTIASARVYVGTTLGVGVFGLLDQSTLTPLQIWRDNHFGNPSNVGAGADGSTPAGDGVANLIKYALGLDPFVRSTRAQLPAGSLLKQNGQSYAVLTVNRVAPPADINYIVEVSADQQTWASSSPNTIALANTSTQLIVQDSTPISTSAPRFIRLRVAYSGGQATSPVWGGTDTIIQGNRGSGSALTVFSQRLATPLESAGIITGISGGTLTDTNASWTSNQFGTNSTPAYVEFNNGSMLDIDSTFAGSSALQLAGNLSGIALVGDTYRIRGHLTVAGLFGTKNETGLLAGPNPSQSDNVLLWLPGNQKALTLFYYADPSFTSWQGWVRADTFAQDPNEVIYPAEGLMVRRLAAGAVNLVSSGQTKSGVSVIAVQRGYNLLGTLKSLASVSLSNLNLYTGDSATGVIGGLNPSASDNLLTVNPDGSTTTYFYYYNPGVSQGWVNANGFTAAGSVQLSPGSAFFINRQSSAGFSWTDPAE